MSTCAEKFETSTELRPPTAVFPAGVRLRLPKGRFFHVAEGDGLILVGNSGQFWVTAENQFGDLFVQAGETLNLNGLKSILIEALCSGDLRLVDRGALLTGIDGTGSFPAATAG